MSVSAEIAAILRLAEERQLLFLLIGGQAVQHFVSARTTQDIDLAIDRDQSDNWNALLIEQGFSVEGIHQNFLRFTHTGAQKIALDTLLVDNPTFVRMYAESSLEQGQRFPRIEHLIALKIFALREDPGLRGLRDLKDVVSLMRVKNSTKVT